MENYTGSSVDQNISNPCENMCLNLSGIKGFQHFEAKYPLKGEMTVKDEFTVSLSTTCQGTNFWAGKQRENKLKFFDILKLKNRKD